MIRFMHLQLKFKKKMAIEIVVAMPFQFKKVLVHQIIDVLKGV